MSDRLEEDLKERIKSYWKRIGKVEERIEELSNKGVDYSVETTKRKELLKNVKYLERKLREFAFPKLNEGEKK